MSEHTSDTTGDLPEFHDPPADPLALARQWIEDAAASGAEDPLAVSLATATPDGVPSVRFVALVSVTEQGAVFATSTQSPKARDMRSNPRVALAMYWQATMRQVRMTGRAGPLPDAESDRLFAALPRGAQASVITARQSQPLESESALRQAAGELEHRAGDLTRPQNWQGMLVTPSELEFWAASDDKLHRRLAYTRSGATWTARRLQP